MTTKTIRIVLVGGGHAHAVALAKGLAPEPGVEIVLVVRDVLTPYSGMVPGVIAGLYQPEEAFIDLLPLARRLGVKLVEAAATGLDRAVRQLHLDRRPPIDFDLLSINVGITPAISGVTGADEHATTVKPISGLLAKVAAIEAGARAGELRSVAVVGGGAAGFEVALALRHRLAPHGVAITLATRDGLLSGHGPRAREAAAAALSRAAVAVVDNFDVMSVEPRRLKARDGRDLEADSILLNTAAAPPAWFRDAGLTLDPGGFIAVGPTLQTLTDPRIFAAGDCAGMVADPRPKAGVFAVRQGPRLAHNLVAAARALRDGGAARLKPYRAQKRALALLSTADERAIASWGAVSAEGAWLWRWKDRLDRDFMTMISEAGAMNAMRRPEAPMIMRDDPKSLSDGLDAVGRTPMDWAPGVSVRAGDLDATVAATSCLPSVLDDRFALGRLAARHGVLSLYAAGVAPVEASIAITLEESARDDEARDLIAGFAQCLAGDGARLGAASVSRGPMTNLTLHALGSAAPERLLGRSSGRSGDVLIITRPIGSGVLLAADRAGALSGAAWIEWQAGLHRSSADALALLRAADAGALANLGSEGLAGAISGLAGASGLAAAVHIRAVPAFDGARELAARGFGVPALTNRFHGDRMPDDAETALLSSPEYAGGLLAAVPHDVAGPLLAAAAQAGLPFAAIGRLIDRMPGADGALLLRD